MTRCTRCWRRSHVAAQCFARTHLNGDPLPSDSSSSSSSDCYSDDSGGSSDADEPEKKKPRSSRSGVYVLQYDGDMYYVGKSADPGQRMQQHGTRHGAACLQGCAQLSEVAPFTRGDEADLEAWERGETLARMRHFGIDRVRGWMFTTKTLSMAQGQEAFRQVCERFDLCRRCGGSSHFAERCFARTSACWASAFVSL